MSLCVSCTQLFQGEGSSAPAAPSGGAGAAAQAPLREPQFGNGAGGFSDGGSQNTLDEPLWVTADHDPDLSMYLEASALGLVLLGSLGSEGRPTERRVAHSPGRR